jgi:hypothetical protein
MTSHGIRSRLAALTLLVSAAACGDNVTQGSRPLPYDDGSGPASSASHSDAKPPTLVAVASFGTSSQLADGPLPPPARDGYFFRVVFDGAGFPAGENDVTRIFGVMADGSKVQRVFALGVIPADGTSRFVSGGSCPSGFREMYAVTVAAGRTTESNHVALGC